MSKSTISTFQLFALFPDEASARKYLEARIWPDGVKCPDCHGDREEQAIRDAAQDLRAKPEDSGPPCPECGAPTRTGCACG